MDKNQTGKHTPNETPSENKTNMKRRDFLRRSAWLGAGALAANAWSALPREAWARLTPEQKKLSRESPFEIKNRLIDLAEKTCREKAAKNQPCHYINAGRGNPDFLNTTARQAFAELTRFAAEAAGAEAKAPDLGMRVETKGMAAKLKKFLDQNSQGPGAEFLKKAIDFTENQLGLNPDEAAFELVDAVQGDFYPDPPRILPVTEKIVNKYLSRILYADNPPKGNFSLFATEGATAAMIYVFKSLRINKVLRPGDHIAIFTPIFSPYLEIPELKEYNLVSIYVEGDEDQGWQLPESEIKKLEDPRVKALFLVNPTNPTSRALNKSTVIRITELVKQKKQDLVIINDTVYATFVNEFHTLGEEIPQNTIGVYSYSKYFGVTGWRLGVVSIFEDCVVDRIIQKLPAKDKKELARRYSLTSTEPGKIKFIDRLEQDSRDVALAHTGGISGPQQAIMCLFSLFELMDREFTYKKTIMDILKRRWRALYQAMDLAEPKSNNLTRYYALVDLKRMAQKRHGQAFSDYLEKKWPLEFLIRLAQNHSTVCLPGEGFAGPKWSLRVALANVKSEDCAKVGENIVSVMDSYYKEWQKKG